jgi:mitochondrial fission protein ELM1
MTAPARITQGDMTRATKAVAAAGLDGARIVMDLANQRIEIIVGGEPEPAQNDDWTDDV